MSENGAHGIDMSSAELRGRRYMQIRKVVARGSSMNNETYLLAQIALILCDVQETLERHENYLREMAVHGVRIQE